MGSRFSWETEDERGWDDPSGQTPSSQSSHRRVWSFAAVVAVIAMGFISAYAYLTHRVADQESKVAAEVLAVHRTWEQSVSGGDLELFGALLSRDDMTWFTTQRRLFLAGRILDLSSLGLAPTGIERDVVVDLAPDWRTAEVTLERVYTAQGDGAFAPPIVLLQTLVYTADGPAWEQSSPGESYWGRGQTLRTERLSVAFPSRDGELIRRVAADLERDLVRLCEKATADGRGGSGPCAPSPQPVSVRFLTDPYSLVELPDEARPLLDGRTFVLPAPSLVGVPLDKPGYEALYAGYAGRILEMLRQSLSLPLPLPEEKLAALCVNRRQALPNLVNYDPLTDDWLEKETNERYRSLLPLPTRTGLVLRSGRPGVDQDRLRLAIERGRDEIPVVDVGGTETTARLAAVGPPVTGESLVIRFVNRTDGVATYALASTEGCAGGMACDPEPLDGFPVWSPDGTRTLMSRGNEILLGGPRGEAAEVVATGFSPFWITRATFGYISLQNEADSGRMAIRVRTVAGEEAQLVDSRELPALLRRDGPKELRLNYLAVSPVDPRLVFVAGSPTGAAGDRYLILSFRLEGDLNVPESLRIAETHIRLELNDTPVGDPSVITPTGQPPFLITGDGRWLVAARFVDPYTNAWELDLHDIPTGETKTLATNYPPYPERFPFYDWSSDWRWLALMDNGIVRLIAPDRDYERVVTHDYAACSYPGWVSQ